MAAITALVTAASDEDAASGAETELAAAAVRKWM
jgi:hypothetical protein